jgi:hypothetical protein
MFAHILQLRLSASTNYLVHLLGDSFAQVQMATQQQILNTFRFDVFVCVCVCVVLINLGLVGCSENLGRSGLNIEACTKQIS